MHNKEFLDRHTPDDSARGTLKPVPDSSRRGSRGSRPHSSPAVRDSGHRTSTRCTTAHRTRTRGVRATAGSTAAVCSGGEACDATAGEAPSAASARRRRRRCATPDRSRVPPGSSARAGGFTSSSCEPFLIYPPPRFFGRHLRVIRLCRSHDGVRSSYSPCSGRELEAAAPPGQGVQRREAGCSPDQGGVVQL